MDVLKAATRRPRKLTRADKLAINRVGVENLVQDIQEVETRAHGLGMHVTAHALNRAKNALGWEMQGEVEKAGKAARDERKELP